MAKPNIDFGNLTQEDTIAIMREAMAQLDDYSPLVQAIKDMFADDIEEIVAQLTD